MTFGATLALIYLRDGTAPRPLIGVLHGVVGAFGLGLLIVALRGPRRGDAMGAGSFGAVAAVLFAMALAIGPFIPLLLKRAPRVGGLVIATHASLAITAFVLFLAWTSMG